MWTRVAYLPTENLLYHAACNDRIVMQEAKNLIRRKEVKWARFSVNVMSCETPSPHK